MSLGKNLLRGSGLNLMDLAIKTVAVFVLTPVLLHTLGTDGYGAWLLGMSLVGYLLLADLGMSFSVTRFLAMTLGAGDSGRETQILTTAALFYRWAGRTVLGLSVVAFVLTPFLGWDAATSRNLQWVVGVCGLSTGFRLLVRTSMIRLRAHVRYDLLAWASLARTAVQTPAMYISVIHGYGVPGVAICYGIGDCLEFLLQQYFARSLPQPASVATAPDQMKSLRREMFAQSRSIMLGIVGESLRLGINPFVIQRLHGLHSVSVYSIGLRLITIIEDVVNALFGGQLLAAFSQLHGGAEKDKLVQTFLRVSCVTAGFSFCTMFGALWIAPCFLQRWLGGEMNDSFQVMLILSLPYALRFTHYPAHNLLYALGKTDLIVAMIVIGGAVSLGLSIVLGLHYGLNGVVASVASVMLVERLLVMPWFIQRCTGIPSWLYVGRNVFWPAAKALVFPGIYAWFARPYLLPDYGRLFILGSGFGAVFLVSFVWMGLDAPARQMLWRQLGSRLRR